MASGRIQQRIDPKLQQQVEAILKALGMKPAQAVQLFYQEIVRQRTLPFHPRPVEDHEIPNARLQKDLLEAERGEGVEEFENEEDFFASLKKL